MFYTTEWVTPEMAKRLLANNPSNRNLRMNGRQSVGMFAEAMRNGEWELNGQDIIVAKTGELNDGQHRLSAVVKANMAVPMGMKFGVERVSRDTLDQGSKRSPGDVLKMRGHKSAIRLASAASFIYTVERGAKSFNNRPRTSEIIETVEQNPGLPDAVLAGGPLISSYRLAPSGIISAIHLCRRVDHTTTDGLIDAIINSVGIDHHQHPAVELRKSYLDHGTGKKRISIPAQAAFFIKAFNALRKGRLVRQMVWREGEAFPRPR
ncbi:MAG: hypothetical protein ROR55_19855 [Devosia sp.]